MTDSQFCNTLYRLNYWSDIAADQGDGFYLLLNHKEKMRLYHYDSTGTLTEVLKGLDGYFNKMFVHKNELWAYKRDFQKFYCFKLR